jgi:hypothetical protein
MAQDSAPFGVYGMDNVVLQIDGVRIQGFGDGDDVISIERNTDLGTPLIGADGASIVSISADRSAKLTLNLLQTSPANQYLLNKVSRQRAGALTGLTFNIGFVDLSCGESGGCTTAIVTKEAMPQKGKNASEREWEIFCPCWEPGTIDVARG